MCSAICCLTPHMMDGGASRQTERQTDSPAGSVVPVLRNPSGYTQALALSTPPLSPLPPHLAAFLCPPAAEQVGDRKGEREEGRAACSKQVAGFMDG